GRARIRIDGTNHVFVTRAGEEIPLPSTADLMREAMAWILSRVDTISKRAAALLVGCELSYEVGAAEDGDKLSVVAVTDDERAWALSDEDDLTTWYVVSGLIEACSEIQEFRTVVRE